jgi:hypothetical protein
LYLAFTDWFHAEAVELEESKISTLLGFKCCKCRRIKSPVCPYADPKPKSEVKKSRRRAAKKEQSGANSDSGTFNDIRDSEPATPVFPVESDPLLFALANVELITESNKLDLDVQRNTASVPGPQKLPVRRHVKHEGDDDSSVAGFTLQAEFSTHSEAGYLSNPAESELPLEYDSAVFDSNLPNNYEFGNDQSYDEKNPNLYFDINELLCTDEGQIDEGQIDGGDLSMDLLKYDNENSGAAVPEEFVNSGAAGPEEFENSGAAGPEEFENSGAAGPEEFENSGAAVPEEFGEFEDFGEFGDFGENIYCSICLQNGPGLDRFCETCGILCHSTCLPWPEPVLDDEKWKCMNCRDWQ